MAGARKDVGAGDEGGLAGSRETRCVGLGSSGEMGGRRLGSGGAWNVGSAGNQFLRPATEIGTFLANVETEGKISNREGAGDAEQMAGDGRQAVESRDGRDLSDGDGLASN